MTGLATSQDMIKRLLDARERAGGGSILDRLRAKNAGRTFNRSHLDDPELWKRLSGPPVLYCEDDGREPETKARRSRQRRPSITTLIKRARMAGERGPVRIELFGGDGTCIVLTSCSEPAADVHVDGDEAERLWHERISKNAAH